MRVRAEVQQQLQQLQASSSRRRRRGGSRGGEAVALRGDMPSLGMTFLVGKEAVNRCVRACRGLCVYVCACVRAYVCEELCVYVGVHE